MRRCLGFALSLWAALGGALAAESPGDAAAPGGSDDLLARLAGGPVPPALLPSRPLAGMRLQAAALLLHGQSGGELPLAVLAVPWRKAEGAAGAEVEVAVLIETDLTSLLDPHRGAPLELESYLYALDGTGALKAHLARSFKLDGQRLAAEIGSGLKVAGRLLLPPGAYSLRVLVREERSGAAGLEVVDLEVPAVAPGAAPPWPLLVPEAENAWAWVSGEEPGAAFPFTVSGRPVYPSARPALRPGQPLRGLLRLSEDQPPPVEPLTGRVRFRLLDGAGDEAAEALAALAVAPGGEGLYEATLEVPQLAEGTYRLAGPSGAATLSVAVAKPGRGPRPGAVAWFHLRPPPALPLPAPDRGAAPPDRHALAAPRRDARRHYAQALELLAAGSPEAARTTLAAFEEQTVRQAPAAATEILGEAERDLAGKLLAREKRCLAPLFLLHLDLWRDDLNRGRLYLAGHQQGMVRSLIDLALRRKPSADEPAPASGRAALLSLAALLQERGLHESARQAFERVLALDGTDPGTLLSLAFLAEANARYPEAVAWLSRLVEAHPRHREGRLRLAINRRRTGDATGAAAMLRLLVAEGNSDWVAPVAVSELARMEAEAGRPERAVAVLDGYRARAGEDRWLAVQLAHLLERRGERERAAEVLRELDAGGAPLGPSPRFLYRTSPREAREAPRAILEREAEACQPLLAEALEKAGQE